MDIGAILLQLLEGFLVTLGIFAFTLVFSIPLGLLVAKGRMAKNIIVSSIFRFYISILRGTPLMLQLLLVYFGPYYLFQIKTGGFTKSQTYFRIILPQVIKTVLPSVSNEVITLVKDTSLAQVLSVSEMFTEAKTLASANVSVIPYIAAGVFYYIMNGVIEMIMTRIEKSMSYYS